MDLISFNFHYKGVDVLHKTCFAGQYQFEERSHKNNQCQIKAKVG